MRYRVFLFVLLASLALLTACGENAPQTAPVDNVFRAVTVTLPEDYSRQGEILLLSDGRVGLLCHDSYSADEPFDTVLFSIDRSGGARSEVVPRILEDGMISGWAEYGDGYVCLDTNWTDCRLYRVSADGQVLFTLDLNEPFDMTYNTRLTVAGNGDIYAAGEGVVGVVSPEGKILGSVSYSGWLDGLCTLADGRVMYSTYDMSRGVTRLYIIDPETLQPGDKLQSPQKLNTESWDVYPGDGECDMFLANTLGVYAYTAGGEPTEICSFTNSDLLACETAAVAVIDRDTIAARGTVFGGGFSETLSILTRVPEDEVTPKQLIRWQTDRTSQDQYNAAVLFNRRSEKYRVVIDDYSRFNTDEDAFVSLSQLDQDIITDTNVPDILTYNGSSFDRYAEAGAFADFYELMDADGSFGRDSLLACVTSPLESDGKLCVMAPRFTVSTMISRQSAPQPWNVDTFLSLDGERPLVKTYRDWLIGSFLGDGMGDYIDLEAGTASFDDGRFGRLIEWLKGYGRHWSDGKSEEEKAVEARFQTVNITQFSHLFAYGGDEVVYVGYPSEGGGTSYVNPVGGVSIYSKSPVKEGAWEFVKFLLREEYVVGSEAQTLTMQYGFPSLREKFDENCALAKEHLFFTNGITLHRDVTNIGDYIAKYEYFTLSDERLASFTAFLESIDQPRVFRQPVLDIIEEELDYYFEGVKTRDECVALVQNRAATYASENQK
ncbi:MAG: extracellular solute-binding protein [Clostridia bacterium]|nr:extracellular solute-binding protein [Clostridia bacterium]